MLILISYDIIEDKKRNRLAKRLKDFGTRVQKSVFEADVTEKEFKKLKQALGLVKLEKNESIRLYQLCEACKGRIQIWGTGKVTEDEDFYIC